MRACAKRWTKCRRWFPADQVEAPQAKFLDVILYSREQLTKEYDAMPDAKGDPALLPRAPWGIISIKAQVMGLPDGDSECECGYRVWVYPIPYTPMRMHHQSRNPTRSSARMLIIMTAQVVILRDSVNRAPVPFRLRHGAGL